MMDNSPNLRKPLKEVVTADKEVQDWNSHFADIVKTMFQDGRNVTETRYDIEDKVIVAEHQWVFAEEGGVDVLTDKMTIAGKNELDPKAFPHNETVMFDTLQGMLIDTDDVSTATTMVLGQKIGGREYAIVIQKNPPVAKK